MLFHAFTYSLVERSSKLKKKLFRDKKNWES